MSPALALARVAAVVGVVWAASAAWRSASAQADARSARAQAESLAGRLAEVQRLRPQQETALLASKPTESVSASLRAALASGGIGDGVLRSVNPGTDEAVPTLPGDAGPAYRRQTIAVELAPVTTRQVWEFLRAWRASEPAWVVTRIDLGHQGPDTESNYSARLTLSTTYLAPPSPPTK